MGDIIDINVQVAVDEVTINATPNNYIINVNRIIGEQVQSDWNVTDDQAPDYIKNKPSIPSIEGLATVVYVDQQDALKVDKVVGKGLSTNDFTDILKTKLDGIQDGAEVNVNADWDATSCDAVILNKPTIPAAVTKTSDLINDGEDGIHPFITLEDIPAGGLTSVGLTMPVAFSVANSPLTSDGTIAVTAAGTSAQYIRGDGQLATMPSGGGGGSSVNYYLNGSVAASVATYKQLSNTAVIGAGTDFSITGNGLITQFLTDVGNPNRIEIPGGAWNFEMWFSMSSNGGTPKFYVELLKYNGTTFTSIANSSAVPETINSGTSIDLYLTSLAVPTTTLLSTDRLAIRVYVVGNSGGRTATLHTEDNHLCEIITTFSGGVTSLNGLTANTQYLSVGTSGTDFNINSVSETHTFNLPTASATNRGALSTTDWSAFNAKQNALTNPITGTGTTNYLPKFTGASALGNSLIFDNGTNVGIGTTAPATSFEVVKSSTFSGQLGSLMLRSDATSTKKMYFGFDDTKNYGYLQSANTGVAFLTTAINPNGGITLIGSSTANGTANLQAYTSTDGIITTFGRVGGTKNSQLSFYGYETGEVQLRYTGSSGDQYLTFFSNGTEKMRITNAGNVGIGVTSPSAKLHVLAPGGGNLILKSNAENGNGGFDIYRPQDNATRLRWFGSGGTVVGYLDDVSGSGLFMGGNWSTRGIFSIYANEAVNPFEMYTPAYGGLTNVPMLRIRSFNANVIGATMIELRQNGGAFFNGNIGVGVSTNVANAKVQIDSTTQGFLPPRMTTTQKNAIATPTSGLVVYDTTLGKLCVRGAAAWETITSI